MSNVTKAIIFCGSFCTVLVNAVPSFSAGVAVGNIDTLALDEASGIAASRSHPGILYSHNDHGDRPRLFAINATTAGVVATLEISSAVLNDWEDIAVGPCSAGEKRSCIYILDDGNYNGPDKRTIYKVAEPDLISSQTLAVEGVLRYNWSEIASDTIMVDQSANVYIISNVLGGRGMIAQLPAQTWYQNYTVNLDSGSFLAVTSTHHDPVGGDISPDGAEVMVKLKEAVYYWAPADGDILAALTHPGIKLPYHQERLGESVCWSADGSAYYTLSEGNYQPLYKYTRQSR